jgi:hypothetical protein
MHYGEGGVSSREQRSRARSRRGGVSENWIAGLAVVSLFFLTAIAIATRPSKFHENSVAYTMSSFVSSIHSLGLVRCFLKHPSLVRCPLLRPSLVRCSLIRPCLVRCPSVSYEIYHPIRLRHVLERQRLLKNEMIGFPHDDDVRLAPAPAHSAQALLSPHCRVIPKKYYCKFNFFKLTYERESIVHTACNIADL